MGHAVLLDGTAYEIAGGRAMADGTAYGVAKGRTLVEGTGYDIPFSVHLSLSFSFQKVGTGTGSIASSYYAVTVGGTAYSSDAELDVPVGTEIEFVYGSKVTINGSAAESPYVMLAEADTVIGTEVSYTASTVQNRPVTTLNYVKISVAAA